MIFHKYQQKKTVKCQFDDDGCQTYLIFQPLYNLLEITGINDTAYVTSWVSICLPTETLNHQLLLITLAPTTTNFNNGRLALRCNNSYIEQNVYFFIWESNKSTCSLWIRQLAD